MTEARIKVGAAVFMQALGVSSKSATKSLYVQAMTFEGDEAGSQLIDLMINSPAKDKRLLIDSFSKVVISDSFVFGSRYFRDKAFREEIAHTRTLIRKAQANGIHVRYTNPIGPLLIKYPLRNHKKMIVVDQEVAYIGGINFSDHNFAWHDMMVEMSGQALSEALHDDFLQTWQGRNRSVKAQLPSGQLYLLNGIKSRDLYESLFDEITNARESIIVISPYISEPLLGHLNAASKKGASVRIISPAENNKGLFQDYLIQKAAQGNFQLHHYPGMFHLKAILIDDKKLVFGSSNYDLVSYYFEQEVVMLSVDPALIEEFKSEVSDKMFSKATAYEPQGRVKFAPSKVALLGAACGILSWAGMKPG